MADSCDTRITLDIAKVDDERRLVFAWGSVARKANGELAEDSGGLMLMPDGSRVPAPTAGDVIDTPEAEQAWEDAIYDFLGSEATADDMHEDWDVAKIVGGLVFTTDLTKQLGIPDGTLPVGALIVSRIPKTDRGNELWAKIKSGERPQMSMVARVEREPVAE